MNMSFARLVWLYLRGPFWWMGLVFALVGLGMTPMAWFFWHKEKAFERNAIRAVATITGKERRQERNAGAKGRQAETVHVLVYTFQDAAGRPVQGKARVSADEWAQTQKGHTRTIEYDQTNPAQSRLTSEAAPTRWGLLLLGGIGLLFAVTGIGLVTTAVVGSTRRARLVRDGTPALGIVDEIAENDSAFKVAGSYRLLYRFTDEAGKTWEGRGPAQPWSLAARWDPNDTILVLYDMRNPRRSEPDVFEARNADLQQLQEQVDEPSA